ncbi:MAG: acyl-CoA synthetase [Actinomycetota bacterium]
MSFPYESVGFWLSRRAALTPRRVAIKTGDRDITYAELDDRAARLAGVLTATGVGPGDRVAALLTNGNEYVESMFACARLGAILTPLSFRLAAPELAFMANDSGSTVLIYGEEWAELAESFRRQTGLKAAFVVGSGPDPSYEEALAAAQPVLEPRAVSSDDVLAIFYTSGTTGRPKGAMLTHGNFFWTNLCMILAFGFYQEERTLVILPMFHCGGWNANAMATWWNGGTVVLERSFDPAGTLATIERERITSMLGVPTMYQMMADDPGFAGADLSSIRDFLCGGAPLPVALIGRYQERGLGFIQGYGLTEAAPNCLILPKEDSVRKAGAAGRPYFYADVRVVDGAGEEVGPGGSGEIVVGGPGVMKGYWNRPEATEETLRGGWLHTGDVGAIDDEGYITIVDRVKDMYISGGENVYPAEIEKVLAGHPAVAEAAVIGVPDDRWGEAGRAIVVLRPGGTAGPEEIRRFCAERLAKFKVPATVVFTDVLPRNPTGKLLKAEIRDLFA